MEDYLAFCAERNEEPEKPFSGTFTVRIPPELHRDAALQAKLTDKSLNSWVTELPEEAVAQGPAKQPAGPRGRRRESGRKAATAVQAGMTPGR